MSKEARKVLSMYEAFGELEKSDAVLSLIRLMEEAQQGRVVSYKRGEMLIVVARGIYVDETYRAMYPESGK